jgi:hypothetical protein
VARIADPDDADDAARHRRLIADGIFTPEELARHYGLTPEELAALTPPKPLSRVAVEAELAEIGRLRRQHRRAYFKDEGLQQRERELLELSYKLQGERATAQSAPDGGDAAGLDPALLAEWQEHGGVEHHLQVARRAVQVALDHLEDDDRSELQDGFNRLPVGSQSGILRFLALQSSGAWRPATDAAVQQFASTDEGATLVESWGRGASHNVGIVRGRMELILSHMAISDRDAATTWFDGLSTAQATAVLRALAEG